MTPAIQVVAIRGDRCSDCGRHHTARLEVPLPGLDAGQAARKVALKVEGRVRELATTTHMDAGVLTPRDAVAAPRTPAEDGRAAGPTEAA